MSEPTVMSETLFYLLLSLGVEYGWVEDVAAAEADLKTLDEAIRAKKRAVGHHRQVLDVLAYRWMDKLAAHLAPGPLRDLAEAKKLTIQPSGARK
jgi:hypothetical protein